jgi:general secretion pathway protein K
MRIGSPQSRRGFALIIVLTIIFVLAILAGGFAYSMKVESRLAANANNESELEWMGRSGVELAKFVLDQSQRGGARFTSLNQLWAGGPGDAQESNSPLAGLNLRSYPLGQGVIGIQIVDLDRKLNLNRIASLPSGQGGGQEILSRALDVMGVDAGELSVIADSILDWKDPDDNTHLSGTESDFYLGLEPPYFAKNGPFDDLAELLLVNGITPEIYWGPRALAHQSQLVEGRRGRRGRSRDRDLLPTYPVGLVDLFVPLSSGSVNINTAGVHVLQVALGIPDDLAANIIRARAGLDGVDGTEDDMPFQNPNLAMVPGLEAMPPGMRSPLTTISTHFEVTVDVRLGRSHRQCVALLGRGIPNTTPGLAGEGNVRVLQFSWK